MCSTDWVFWKSWKCSRKMLMSVSCFSNVNLWLYQNRTPPWMFFKGCSYFFHDFYLFSEPTNNHCFDWAAQGQLSKCNRRNSITTISSLIKGSWLKQNEKELSNLKSRNAIILAENKSQGLGAEGQGINNRILALLCLTDLVISHAVQTSV